MFTHFCDPNMYVHELGSYTENEDFLCLDDSEPHVRSQNIILHSNGFKWHIKITYNGKLIIEEMKGDSLKAQKRYSIRRQQLRKFTSCIKFECLSLLENTVTEIEFELSSVLSKILSLSSKIKDLSVKNGYCQFMNRLHYRLGEDLSKTQYPAFIKDPSISTMTLASLRTLAPVAPGIFRVRIEDDIEERSYIFKSIDKSFNETEDTAILQQELQNLKMIRHSNIVQLISVVTSDNSYHIRMTQDPYSVLRGFLLEYHPGGTLEEALKNHRVHCGLRKWPFQIACGLEQLHRLKIAHMNLKPSNVVLDAKDDAILIDISGIAFTND